MSHFTEIKDVRKITTSIYLFQCDENKTDKVYSNVEYKYFSNTIFEIIYNLLAFIFIYFKLKYVGVKPI
jgi:hypothetical protein